MSVKDGRLLYCDNLQPFPLDMIATQCATVIWRVFVECNT